LRMSASSSSARMCGETDSIAVGILVGLASMIARGRVHIEQVETRADQDAGSSNCRTRNGVGSPSASVRTWTNAEFSAVDAHSRSLGSDNG